VGSQALDDLWKRVTVFGKIDVEGQQQAGTSPVPRQCGIAKGAVDGTGDETGR
jgi:hypothetical protein